MVRMTFSISEDLKKRLDTRPDVNWSEVLKERLKKRLESLEKLHAQGEL
ncbi:MAG: hypothetical protein MUO73_02350 [Thermoplasmata archaeon]|jgi:hypothetical protein|nr:hypothetical protein [Thermoplasmata archaeon]